MRNANFGLVSVRKTFAVTSVSDVLLVTASAIAADGAVFYLNGVEGSRRENMPSGTLTLHSLASSTCAVPKLRNGVVATRDAMGGVSQPAASVFPDSCVYLR